MPCFRRGTLALLVLGVLSVDGLLLHRDVRDAGSVRRAEEGQRRSSDPLPVLGPARGL